MHECLAAQASTQEVLREASSRLSDISHFVGLVTVPRRDRFAFRHIDFVRLDERRVLAILVFTDGEIQNRAVEMPRPLSASELEWIANYLNQNYARSDEHTSELQSLMRISNAVFCLKKNTNTQ